jgi:hypothetical protein
MTSADFLAALEQELHWQGLAFSRAELLAFVAAAWPWIDDDPDVERWANEFSAAGRDL